MVGTFNEKRTSGLALGNPRTKLNKIISSEENLNVGGSICKLKMLEVD